MSEEKKKPAARGTSTRPRAARTRLRRAHERGERDTDQIKKDIAIAYGKPLEEWDWEELSRGRARPAGEQKGNIRGRKPKILAEGQLLNMEAQRRMRALSEHEILTMADEALRCLFDLMTDDEVNEFGSPMVPAGIKFQAAKYIMDHVIGTPKQRHEVSGTNPLAELMGGILVNPDGEPSHDVPDVVDGEVVEDGDE
jgi:hypothetical protein